MQTNEELGSKIVFLKKNHVMPNLANESSDVQSIIRAFYYNQESRDNFWFNLAFCNYEVTNEFVHDINREYKRCLIKNIAKDEIIN